MGTYWAIYNTFDSRLNCAHDHQHHYQYFGKFIKPNFSWGLCSILLVNSFKSYLTAFCSMKVKKGIFHVLFIIILTFCSTQKQFNIVVIELHQICKNSVLSKLCPLRNILCPYKDVTVVIANKRCYFQVWHHILMSGKFCSWYFIKL